MLKRMWGALVLAGLLAGCNTIQGAGKDLESGGQKIQSAAEHVKQKM